MASKIDIAHRVISEVAHGSEEATGIFLPDVIAMIPTTLNEMCRQIDRSGDGNLQHLISRQFTGTIVDDTEFDYVELDNSSFMSATEPLILNPPFRTVDHSTLTETILYCPDHDNLAYKDVDEDFAYYAIKVVSSTSTRLLLNSASALTGSISLIGSAVVLVTNLPPELEQMLVDMLKARVAMVAAAGGRGAKKK